PDPQPGRAAYMGYLLARPFKHCAAGQRSRGRHGLPGQRPGEPTDRRPIQRVPVAARGCPFTTARRQSAPEEIQVYIVQPGDTVLGIADKFGLKPETIQWSNPGLELNADLIRPGDPLKIPPVDGVLHTVTSGDTLLSLAAKYKV